MKNKDILHAIFLSFLLGSLLIGCSVTKRQQDTDPTIVNSYQINNVLMEKHKNDFLSVWIFDDEFTYQNNLRTITIVNDSTCFTRIEFNRSGMALSNKEECISYSDQFWILLREIVKYEAGEACLYYFAPLYQMRWSYKGKAFSMYIGDNECSNKRFLDSFDILWNEHYSSQK